MQITIPKYLRIPFDTFAGHVGALAKPQTLQEPNPRDPRMSTEIKAQLCLDFVPTLGVPFEGSLLDSAPF